VSINAIGILIICCLKREFNIFLVTTRYSCVCWY